MAGVNTISLDKRADLAAPQVEAQQRLSQQYREVLHSLIAPGSKVALLDFPNHSNAGDSAIWLGETRYLQERDVDLVYWCDCLSYSRRKLANRIGDNTILIHGGGNLGDLWPLHQRLRERVVTDFPKNRIIQLPQSIHFVDSANLDRARRTLDSHRNLTILARDARSFAIAKREFRATVKLCPDAAFMLGTLDRPTAPRADTVFVARTDHESNGMTLPHSERSDWIGVAAPSARHPGKYRRAAILRDVFGYSVRGRGWAPSGLRRRLRHVCDPFAEEAMWAGCRMLSDGRVVITDRLHGHIFCLLMGIPHVGLDNIYGKLRNFATTWNTLSPWARLAATPEEAADAAACMLRAAES